MKKVVFDMFSMVVIGTVAAAPAWAGCIAPAPVAGVGLGALAILGFGYRALRKRIDG